MASSNQPKNYQTVGNPLTPNKEKTTPNRTLILLGVLRIIAGAGTLFAPSLAGRIFAIPISGSGVPLARGFGVRELVLGELLITAESGKEVKRALVAGAACDAVDIGIAITSLAAGHVSRMGAGLFGGAGVTLLALGLVGFKTSS